MNKINKLSILILSCLTVFIFSCKNEEKADKPTDATTQTASAEEMKASMTKNDSIKYNPAHGEEGHRCDLPVGAPLGKATAQNTTPEMTTSPVRMQNGASPKVNPPHGEPGHDCSVPVGAELEN